MIVWRGKHTTPFSLAHAPFPMTLPAQKSDKLGSAKPVMPWPKLTVPAYLAFLGFVGGHTLVDILLQLNSTV
jgi:hypothetical protein